MSEVNVDRCPHGHWWPVCPDNACFTAWIDDATVSDEPGAEGEGEVSEREAPDLDVYCPSCGSCGYTECCGFSCRYLAAHREAWNDMREFVNDSERELMQPTPERLRAWAEWFRQNPMGRWCLDGNVSAAEMCDMIAEGMIDDALEASEGEKPSGPEEEARRARVREAILKVMGQKDEGGES